MSSNKLRADDRGVSPVIGVILMVAITVILAAVIGVFVLGLGDQVSQTAPQASISISDAADTIDDGVPNTIAEISHEGGDDISSANLEVVIVNQDTDSNVVRLSGEFTGGEIEVYLNNPSQSFTGQSLKTGDRLLVVDNTTTKDFDPGVNYRVILVDQETGQQIASNTITVE